MSKWFKLSLALGILALVVHFSSGDDIYVNLHGTSDLFKTVAHVDLSHRTDLELVYTDIENDIAYYRYIGSKPRVYLNDLVYLNDGSECTITYIDAFGFAFTGDTKAYQGLSGTAVRDADGNQLGYISRVMNENEIYCIWS